MRSALSLAHNFEALKSVSSARFSLFASILAVGVSSHFFSSPYSSEAASRVPERAPLERHEELSQSKSLERVEDSWEVFSVNKDTVLISNIDNNDFLAIVFSIVNISHSAGFNKTSVSHFF